MSRTYRLGIVPASPGSNVRKVLFDSQYCCHFFSIAVKL